MLSPLDKTNSKNGCKVIFVKQAGKKLKSLFALYKSINSLS